ncbi:MAG TPA: NAD(P)/FAD-dependent oxidoreductase [Thermoanaerobaculia bacterium]|nr:NAD(P)/FAD-dependent oxidoreductase [Thermoanaerobaculia bacterium]
MARAPSADSPDYDVIVMGGGPAGSTVATLVADAGHRVALLERLPETGFKIGESLMPETYRTFARLGLLERLYASPFPRKYSVQFYSKSGRASAPFYFQETDPGEGSITWQVPRRDFDRLLLENARDHGVEVRQGATVREVLFAGERAAGVLADLPGEGRRELAAKVVVDATGQSAVLGRRLGLREIDPRLKKAAIFSHFEGALRDPGIDEGATLVLHTEQQESWFWYIPLPHDRVSVGVVGSVEYLVTGRGGDLQRVFDEEVARCPPLQPRLAGARRVMDFLATRDFSYRSRQIAGDGWVLVGDAFGFLDPIYSSGVLLAFSSGEFAADAILGALATGDFSAARLGAFGPRFSAGMDAMRRLVYTFYDPNFRFSKFIRRFPDCRLDLIRVLRGDVFDHDFSRLFAALAATAVPDAPAATDAAPAEGGLALASNAVTGDRT